MTNLKSVSISAPPSQTELSWHYIQKNSQEAEEASVKEEKEEVCTKWQLPKWANVSALLFGLIAPREEGRQMVQQQQQQH